MGKPHLIYIPMAIHHNICALPKPKSTKPQFTKQIYEQTLINLARLTSSLSSNGYSVQIRDAKVLSSDADYLASVSMMYGPNRRDCKGGYILIREDGTV